MENDDIIRSNLSHLLSELESQSSLAAKEPGKMMFTDWIQQVRDWIDVGEYGIAYESMVAALEAESFVITSAGAIKLLEIGLIIGFKTDRPVDAMFRRGE